MAFHPTRELDHSALGGVSRMVLMTYINLARDLVRAEAMTQAFAGCRHEPKRFEAVNWRAG